MLGTPPSHVLSTSILYSYLLHDSRFRQVPMSDAARGDIVIASQPNQADGYAGIVVDHGRVVRDSSKAVQNDSNLVDIKHSRPPMAIFRYVGVEGHQSGSLANAGFNPDEPRLRAGQPGGGRWTSGMAPSITVLSGRNTLLSDQFGGTGGSPPVVPASVKTTDSAGDAAQVRSGKWRVAGTGTINQLKQARQKLDEGYAKEVEDIKNMRGISDEEKNTALQSLQKKYQKARDDLGKRISKIEQAAQDLAFAYGGKASDYYEILDDSDPKIQELMDTLDHMDSYGLKDTALLYLRRLQGGKPPSPTDPHVLRSALLAATGALGEEESAAEKSISKEANNLEKEAAALRPYGEGGGHHVPAKSAFKGDSAYNPSTAPAIPNSELDRLTVDHDLVTGAQQSLYRAYAQTGKPLTWDAVQSIETEALVKGGMDRATAEATVSKAINTLKAAGVKQPTRIPWGGK